MWRYIDAEVSSDWVKEGFDDSSWSVGKEGTYLPLFFQRYYRTSFSLYPDVFEQYSSFEFYFYHLYSVEVYINGVHFLTHDASSSDTPLETVKREALDRYFHSLSVTVAVHISWPVSPIHDNHTTDPFTAHLVFLSFETPTSKEMKLRSEHDMDFYAHPLNDAFDSNRKTEWWFKGHNADVYIEYHNPLYFWNSLC